MAAPSYTEDLTDIATGDEAAGWVELTGTDGLGEDYDTQGAPAYEDPDYPFIQGSFSVTQDCTKDAGVGSLGYATGGITIPTDGAVFVWQNYMVASNIYNYATGGFRLCIGSSLTDFDVFYVGGVDKSPYPYGGWDCQVANDTVSPDDVAGSPTGTISYVAGAVYVVTGSSKGEVHNVDVMRYGRGSAIFEEGQSDDPATIAGFAAQNDNSINRWGLIQETSGGYLWQGRMLLGSDSTSSYFVDSNINVFIKWTPKVTENFNLIEIKNIDTYVSMTGFTFQVLDVTTASRGRLLMSDPADVDLDQCTFVDMNTFIFDTTTGFNTVSITDTTFRRCGEVTQGGAVFDGCAFINSDATSTIQVNNLDNIDNCVFESDGSNHAMELDSNHAGGSFTLVGCTYENYAASDGDTGNEVIYNNSGGAVTINVSGGDVPTIRNGIGSSTTVVASVIWNFEIRNADNEIVSGSEFRIYNSGTITQVFGVETSDGTEQYTFDQSLAGSDVDVVVHTVDTYLYFRQTLARPAGTTTTALFLTEDKWYSNPDITKTKTWGLRPDDDYKTMIDTYIDTVNTTTNYGTSQDLEGFFANSYILVNPKIADGIFPSNATITSAKLYFYIHTIFSDVNFRSFYCKRDWVEIEATWNIYSTGNNWQTAGADGANDIGAADGPDNTTSITGWLAVDVSPSLQDFVDGTITDFNGWKIEQVLLAGDATCRSSEYIADTSLRPYLEVTWTQ